MGTPSPAFGAGEPTNPMREARQPHRKWLPATRPPAPSQSHVFVSARRTRHRRPVARFPGPACRWLPEGWSRDAAAAISDARRRWFRRCGDACSRAAPEPASPATLAISSISPPSRSFTYTAAVMCMGETKHKPSRTPLRSTTRSTSSVMCTISRSFFVSKTRYSV